MSINADLSAYPAWIIHDGLSPYGQKLEQMENHVSAMIENTAGEEIWLVEHHPVITAGTSSQLSDLIDPNRFPVLETGRGGKFTYHGPGQRVIYPMLNLSNRGKDIRKYVGALEAWAINALSEFDIKAFAHEAGTGIWVECNGGIAKIGAIGVRVRKWISFHGMAINVSTSLDHYDAIIPCGISEHGITSLASLRPELCMQDLDKSLKKHLPTMLHSLA